MAVPESGRPRTQPAENLPDHPTQIVILELGLKLKIESHGYHSVAFVFLRPSQEI
jgi:hypothetical protein